MAIFHWLNRTNEPIVTSVPPSNLHHVSLTAWKEQPQARALTSQPPKWHRTHRFKSPIVQVIELLITIGCTVGDVGIGVGGNS